MTTLKLQIALGGFAFITLLLAGTAVGRLFSISFGDALYLTGVLLVALGWLGSWVMLGHCTTSSKDREA